MPKGVKAKIHVANELANKFGFTRHLNAKGELIGVTDGTNVFKLNELSDLTNIETEHFVQVKYFREWFATEADNKFY